MAMSTPTFRYAVQADTSALAALIERAYRSPVSDGRWSSEAHLLKGPRTSEEEISGLIARDDTRFLIAEIDGKLAGCCLLQGLSPDPASKTVIHDGARQLNAAYFGMFAIDPASHGGGLGKIVIAEAERRVHDLWRANQMVMTVINLRTELIGWYQRRGYVLTGAAIAFPFSETSGETTRDFHLVEMRKTLA